MKLCFKDSFAFNKILIAYLLAIYNLSKAKFS